MQITSIGYALRVTRNVNTEFPKVKKKFKESEVAAKICIQEEEASFGLFFSSQSSCDVACQNWKKEHRNNEHLPRRARMKRPSTAVTTARMPWPGSFKTKSSSRVLP